MRRWLWPYALLAIVLTLMGAGLMVSMLTSLGDARIGGRIAAADALVIEPAKGVLISLLDFIAPFEVPGWVKTLYANLVILAGGAMVLSLAMGILLLPIFYAVYRGSRPD
ncbi:MAG: hypothetical protein ABL973_08270 [Micropepsaceae bacterium]